MKDSDRLKGNIQDALDTATKCTMERMNGLMQQVATLEVAYQLAILKEELVPLLTRGEVWSYDPIK